MDNMTASLNSSRAYNVPFRLIPFGKVWISLSSSHSSKLWLRQYYSMDAPHGRLQNKLFFYMEDFSIK